MISPEDVVVEYRGYLLLQEVCTGSGTNRIVRPDGTWRFSEPTQVGYSEIDGWIVARRLPDGLIEMLDAYERYDEARRKVDSLVAS